MYDENNIIKDLKPCISKDSDRLIIPEIPDPMTFLPFMINKPDLSTLRDSLIIENSSEKCNMWEYLKGYYYKFNNTLHVHLFLKEDALIDIDTEVPISFIEEALKSKVSGFYDPETIPRVFYPWSFIFYYYNYSIMQNFTDSPMK